MSEDIIKFKDFTIAGSEDFDTTKKGDFKSRFDSDDAKIRSGEDVRIKSSETNDENPTDTDLSEVGQEPEQLINDTGAVSTAIKDFEQYLNDTDSPGDGF